MTAYKSAIAEPYPNETALWKAIIHNQKQAWLKMDSGSMFPLMPTGAQILVKSIEPQKINPGEIVLYIDNNQLIAHRLLKINREQNQCLQGGDNAVSTSFISMKDIIGVVEKIKHNGKEIDISSCVGLYLRKILTSSSIGIADIRLRWPKLGNLLQRLRIMLVQIIVKYLL